MDIYYQIVLLGSPYYDDELKQLLDEYPFVQIVSVEEVCTIYPVLYLYYGKSQKDQAYKGSVDLETVASTGLILPIVRNLSRFKDYIPQELLDINALRLANKGNVVKLRDYILRFFGLIYGNRKVFISYKRSDTENLAKQLFLELSLEGFHPFLDISSVEEGVLFQDELKHELVDCEVFVYLNSANYMKSKFTLEELKIAQLQSLGIVQVVLPQQSVNNNVFCQTIYNVDASLEQNEVVKNIVQQIHNVRAASYAYRRKSILDAIQISKKSIKWIRKNNVYVDSYEVFQVCTCFPKSNDIYDADVKLKKLFPNMKRVIFYDGRYCKSFWRKNILWQNKYLPIKIIDIHTL